MQNLCLCVTQCTDCFVTPADVRGTSYGQISRDIYEFIHARSALTKQTVAFQKAT